MKIRILVINDDCLSAEAISNERLARGFGLNTRLITKADFLQSARYNRLMALDAMLSEHVLFTLEDIYGSHYEVINSSNGGEDPRLNEDEDDKRRYKRTFKDALFLDNFEFYSLQEHSFFDVEFISSSFDGIFFFFHKDLSRDRDLNHSLLALLGAVDCPPVFMFNLALEKESLRYLVQDCEHILHESALTASFMNADHYGQFEYFMRVVLPKAHRVYFIYEEQRALVSRYYNLFNECLKQNRQDELIIPPFKLSHNGYLNFRRSEAIITAARSFRIVQDYKEHGFDMDHIIGYTDSYLIKEPEKVEVEDPIFDDPDFGTFGDSRMVLNSKHYIDVGHNAPECIDEKLKKVTYLNGYGVESNDPANNIPFRNAIRSSCSSYVVIEGEREQDNCAAGTEAGAANGAAGAADAGAASGCATEKCSGAGVVSTNEMLNEADQNAHLEPCSFNCPKVFKDEFIASGRHRFTVAISCKFFGYNQTLGLDIRGINLIRSVCDAFPNARIVLFLNENLYSFLDDIAHSDTIIHEQTDCFIRANTIKMRQMSKVLMGDVDSAGSLSFAICSRVNRSLNQHIKTQIFLEQEALKGENAPTGLDRFNGEYYGSELQSKVEKLNNIVDDCFINLDYQGLFKTDVDLLISDHLHERVVAQSNGVAAFKLKYNEDKLKEKVFLDQEYLEAFLASTFDFDLVPPLYVQFQGLSTLIANELRSQSEKQHEIIKQKEEMLKIVGTQHIHGPLYYFAKEGLDYEAPREQLPQSELLPSLSLEGLLLHGRSVREQILGLSEKYDIETLNDIILKYERGCALFENDLKQVFSTLYSSKHVIPTALLDDSKDEEPTMSLEEMSEAGFAPSEVILSNDESALEALGDRDLDVGDVNNAMDAGFSEEENQQEIEEAGKGLRVAQQSNFTYGKRYGLQWSFLRFFVAIMQSCAHRPEIRVEGRSFSHNVNLNSEPNTDFKTKDRGSTMAYTMAEFDREFIRARARRSESDPTLRGMMEDRMYSDHEDTAVKPITLLEEYIPPLFKPMSLSLLSFGCSRGEEVMDLLSYFNGQSVKGVDISEGAISKARQMLKNLRRLNRFEMLVEFKKLYHLGAKFYEGYTPQIINSMVQHKINLGTVELLAKNDWLTRTFGTESKIFTEFLGNLRPSGGVIKQTGLIGYIEFLASSDFFAQRERYASELARLKQTIRDTMNREELDEAQTKLRNILLSEIRSTQMMPERIDEHDTKRLNFLREIDIVLSAAFRNAQSRSASFLRNLYNAYSMLNALHDDMVFERLPEVMYPDFSDRNLSYKLKTSESEVSAAFNRAKSARDLMDASAVFAKSRKLIEETNGSEENMDMALSNELSADVNSKDISAKAEKREASIVGCTEEAGAVNGSPENGAPMASFGSGEQIKMDLADGYVFVERLKIEQYDAVTAMTVLCRHPETTKLTNAHHIYPFGEFKALLDKLDSMVKTGGFLCIFNANYRLEDTDLNDKYVRVFPFYDSTKVTSLLKMEEDEKNGTADYDDDFKKLRLSPNSSVNDYSFELLHKLTQLHFDRESRHEAHTICLPEDLRRMYERADSFNKFGHTALFDGKEQRIIRKDIGSIFLKIRD